MAYGLCHTFILVSLVVIHLNFFCCYFDFLQPFKVVRHILGSWALKKKTGHQTGLSLWVSLPISSLI